VRCADGAAGFARSRGTTLRVCLLTSISHPRRSSIWNHQALTTIGDLSASVALRTLCAHAARTGAESAAAGEGFGAARAGRLSELIRAARPPYAAIERTPLLLGCRVVSACTGRSEATRGLARSTSVRAQRALARAHCSSTRLQGRAAEPRALEARRSASSAAPRPLPAPPTNAHLLGCRVLRVAQGDRSLPAARRDQLERPRRAHLYVGARARARCSPLRATPGSRYALPMARMAALTR
jgi:hypothetical protein